MYSQKFTDPVYMFLKSDTVSNWSGVFLDPIVRDDLKEGCIVRAIVSNVLTDDKLKIYSSSDESLCFDGNTKNQCIRENGYIQFVSGFDNSQCCSIYFRLLKKLDKYKYLANIVNMYMSEHNDIVVVIDTRSITEIPLEWTGNEHLSKYDRDEGPGTMTGSLAARQSTTEYTEYYFVKTCLDKK